MVCGYFILPEPASYVFFYAIFNLRNLFYLIVFPLPVPVYGRRRVLLNRGWSLGEEEDHHNGGRKARSSG